MHFTQYNARVLSFLTLLYFAQTEKCYSDKKTESKVHQHFITTKSDAIKYTKWENLNCLKNGLEFYTVSKCISSE